MGILRTCEKIGAELRETNEGKAILELVKKIRTNPQEITFEFFKLINKYYIELQFYSVPHTFEVLKYNLGNPLLGDTIKNILKIAEIEELAHQNVPFGKFVENLVISCFNSNVKYETPEGISATPQLIRLSNTLSVDCLKTDIISRISKGYHTDPLFTKLLEEFDKLNTKNCIVPYSKTDRKNLKILKEKYNPDYVELVYMFISTLTYMKAMIFDSFYDNMVEIFENPDIIHKREKSLSNGSLIKISTSLEAFFRNNNKGWILKLHNCDGTISYGQIFHKSFKFKCDDAEDSATIKAIINKNI